MKDVFFHCHPLTIMAYFGTVLLFSMILMHPACLLISWLGAAAYYIKLKGWRGARPAIIFIMPTMLITALVNPAFNHEGITILGYLPGGNPLTLESILLGGAAALALVAIMGWFACFSQAMSADKFVYLFGRITPSLALILSMALRLVPGLSTQARSVAAAQKGIGNDPAQGSLGERFRRSSAIMSILTTWSLENAIETADSMKSRGYGLKGRSAYSPYRMDSRDRLLLAFIAVLATYIAAGAWQGFLYCQYLPVFKTAASGAWHFSLLAAYLALCAIPLGINLWEDRKWQLTQSKA